MCAKKVKLYLQIENRPAGWRDLLKRYANIHIPDDLEYEKNLSLTLNPDQVVELVRWQWSFGWRMHFLECSWITTNGRVTIRDRLRNWLILMAEKL